MKQKIKHFYESKYKWLMVIPFLLVILAITQIAVQYATTGDFVNRGISLKGGSIITLDYSEAVNIDNLQANLQTQFPSFEVSVRTLSSARDIEGVVIESTAQTKEEIDPILAVLTREGVTTEGHYSVEIIGSALGESFFTETAIALLVAFGLMGVVVFIYFRSPIPSLAVMLAAFSDIVVTLAVFNLTGMKLSTAGVSAFLMLIGYSVDSDMLLTARVLKRREGTIHERIYSALSTGMTMTATTLMVLLVAILFVASDTIKQIMIILFIGLGIDLIMTWIQNVGILRWYLEKGHEKK